jgi:hypothetical protein
MAATRQRTALVALAGACLLAGSACADAPPQPRIACDQATFDFGERQDSETVEHEFRIRNDGTAPLVIKNVRASCGCTVATVSSRRLESGQTAVVKARLNLKGRRGAQRKSITIESNDPSSPRFPLWMTGTAIIEIGMDPGFVNFGQVVTDKPISRHTTLLSRDPSVTIVSVSGGSPDFDAVVLNDTNGLARNVKITAKMPLSQGFHRATYVVTTTHPTTPTLNLSVSLLVPEPVYVIPRSIVLRGTHPDGLSRAMIVRPGSDRTFDVLGVKVPDERITSEIIPIGRGNYRIVLSGLPVSKELNGSFVEIETSLPGFENVRVPIHVMGP